MGRTLKPSYMKADSAALADMSRVKTSRARRLVYGDVHELKREGKGRMSACRLQRLDRYFLI